MEKGKVLLASLAILMVFAAAFFNLAPKMPEASGFMAVLLAIPAIYYLYRSLGRKAIPIFIVLGVFSMAVETFGLATGLPYGWFYYSDLLGTRLGLAPWPVFFAFPPLLLGAYALFHGSRYDYIKFPLFLLAIDLVLDPGSVVAGYWWYAEPSAYYGIPLSNFLGWLVTGSIGYLIVRKLVKKKLSPWVMSSLVLTVLFWTCFAAFNAMIIPAAIGTVLIAFTASKHKIRVK